jgi:hypothetical protein
MLFSRRPRPSLADLLASEPEFEPIIQSSSPHSEDQEDNPPSPLDTLDPPSLSLRSGDQEQIDDPPLFLPESPLVLLSLSAMSSLLQLI